MIKKITENRGVTLYDININDNHATGIAISIPNSAAEILEIRCNKGTLSCRIFDKEIIEMLEMPAAIFSNPTFEEMMSGKPLHLSKKAVEMGATLEMTGAELVELLS